MVDNHQNLVAAPSLNGCLPVQSPSSGSMNLQVQISGTNTATGFIPALDAIYYGPGYPVKSWSVSGSLDGIYCFPWGVDANATFSEPPNNLTEFGTLPVPNLRLTGFSEPDGLGDVVYRGQTILLFVICWPCLKRIDVMACTDTVPNSTSGTRQFSLVPIGNVAFFGQGGESDAAFWAGGETTVLNQITNAAGGSRNPNLNGTAPFGPALAFGGQAQLSWVNCTVGNPSTPTPPTSGCGSGICPGNTINWSVSYNVECEGDAGDGPIEVDCSGTFTGTSTGSGQSYVINAGPDDCPNPYVGGRGVSVSLTIYCNTSSQWQMDWEVDCDDRVGTGATGTQVLSGISCSTLLAGSVSVSGTMEPSGYPFSFTLVFSG